MHVQREFIEISAPELPIRSVIKSSATERITADAHLHSEIELIKILEGEMTFFIDQKQITLIKGDLIFINSMVVHTTTIPPDTITEIFVLQFNTSAMYTQPIFQTYHHLITFMNHDSLPFYVFTQKPDLQIQEISDLINKIILEFTHKELTYELSIKAYLYRILSLMYRSNLLALINPDFSKEVNDLFIKLEPIFAYTASNFREDISLETVSDILHFNTSYFCRLFKRATGKSYVEYLNYVRVLHSEDLLLTTSDPITSILNDSGFSNLSYFNRVFKHYRGISPSNYRKQKKGASLPF